MTYLITHTTKVVFNGIIGSWAAFHGLGVENIIIAELTDIENWFNRN
jgi:hypothetical protein